MPVGGSRIEGDGLELGVFTQDLAQDLVSFMSYFGGLGGGIRLSRNRMNIV